MEYIYNAWGELLGITGSMRLTLGLVNPLRYRSYVYDHETGLYYLQSRYYDPKIGRFISADDYISTGQGGEFWNYVIGGLVGVVADGVVTVVRGEDIGENPSGS